MDSRFFENDLYIIFIAGGFRGQELFNFFRIHIACLKRSKINEQCRRKN